MSDSVTESVEQRERQLVVFRIRARRYAVPIEAVVELTLLGECAPLLGAPEWVRGIMQLRDEVVPIIDMPKRSGMQSSEFRSEELKRDLEQFKKDHIALVAAFEASPPDPEIPAFATDEVNCTLSRWREDPRIAECALAHQLERLEEAHRELHDFILPQSSEAIVAAKAFDSEAGELDAKRVALNESLRLLLSITDEVVGSLGQQSREMAVILRGENENLGLAVDEIDSVAMVETEQIAPRPLGDLGATDPNSDILVSTVVRSTEAEGLIQILDVHRLFKSVGSRTIDDFRGQEK